MIDTGEYQNQINGLPMLDMANYERIFKIFKSSLDDKEFYTYNILKNIQFPTIDSSYIQYFTPSSKMAMSLLSYKIYGDIKSWWILYLLNKDKFEGAPFYVDGGVQIKYVTDEFRSLIYDDIIKSTVYGGRHY
jgi:hypothetical protein